VAGCGSYAELVDTGDLAFERKQFAKAAELYELEYYDTEDGVKKAQKAYLVGQSLTKANLRSKSADWYERAYTDGYGPTALREYAYALKFGGHYAEAADAFSELVDLTVDNYRYKQEIKACQSAAIWKANASQSSYSLSLLELNTSYSEQSSHLSKDGHLLLSSDRPRSASAQEYTWTGNFYYDIYIYTPIDGEILALDKTINTKYNEGASYMTSDQLGLYLTRCGEDDTQVSHCYLYQSNNESNSWSAPSRLAFQRDGYNYSYPCLARNDELLLFSSNIPGGRGGYDLYVCEMTPDGWSDPQALPSTINTEFDELSPFMYEDTLYFSSDGHLGMGGLDVFQSYVNPEGKWSSPSNLRAPINSSEDDFGFTHASYDNSNGYLTSNRHTGRGSDDIYSWTRSIVKVPTSVNDTVVTDSVVPELAYSLRVQVVAPRYTDISDPSTATGEMRGVKNASITFKQAGRDGEGYIADPRGEALTEGRGTDLYTISVAKAGYFSNEVTYDPGRLKILPVGQKQIVTVLVVLDRIFPGREITIDRIYYDLDKANIREDAEPALDSLATLLLANPSIQIELNAHTDCRGELDYNQDLSQRRAESVVNYLVDAGIASERLVPIGYGESRLLDTCPCQDCTEDQHQRNRRTTFSVVE